MRVPMQTRTQVPAATTIDWRRLRARLCGLAPGLADAACVPLAGMAGYALEATIATLVAPGDRVLVAANTDAGRIRRIAERAGREVVVGSVEGLDLALAKEPRFSHVVVPHVDRGTGELADVESVARVVHRAGRALIVDAPATLGVVPILAGAAAIVGSGEGVGGPMDVSYVLATARTLATARGRPSSFAIDLHDRWRCMDGDVASAFAPPYGVAAALERALDRLDARGTLAERFEETSAALSALVDAMRQLGFEAVGAGSPVLVAFHVPGDERFSLPAFIRQVCGAGFAIRPGVPGRTSTFRITFAHGITPADVSELPRAVLAALNAQNVANGRPTVLSGVW